MTVPLSIIATAPDRIWLDVGEISPLLDEGTRFQDLADVTWSEDNATGHGIRYERADRAERAAPMVDLQSVELTYDGAARCP